MSTITSEKTLRVSPHEPQKMRQKEVAMEKTVKIEGMMCEHCEATVKKALEKLPFISEAKPSHTEGKAVITLSGDLDEEAVKTAIEDRDYSFVGIE